MPHQIALDPVQEETSDNENSDEDTDEESLGARNIILIDMQQYKLQLDWTCGFILGPIFMNV